MSRTLRLACGAALVFLGAHALVHAQSPSCTGCHAQRVAEVSASSHAGVACATCHEGAVAHAADVATKPAVHFDLELCGGCHASQYGTYVYGDGWKTPYGGSPTQWSKLNDFAHYNDVIDGYGFTREYNEERSHGVMLQDHYDVTRGKFDTCIQCKSTQVAYYWDSGKERTVRNPTVVQGAHMAQPISVPAGTTVRMSTDRQAAYPKTHEAQVLVTLPDGTRYASFDTAGAVKNTQWTWSALYALTVNELAPTSPTRASGNGCNHCHAPHKVRRDTATGELVGFRIIRKSLLDAISRRHINPTDPGSPTSFGGDTPLSLDEKVALCAQCHVEYVCGNSPIDGIDRDFFPWAKVSDLEAIYQAQFPGYGPYADRKYVQDWTHGTGALSSPFSPGNGISYLTPFPIREALVKSQHPEAETYWESRHYGNGAACSTCHMPRVTRAADGTRFTSHWMASPIKYMTAQPVAAFAGAFGLSVDRDGLLPPCGACHGGNLANMKSRAGRIQDDVYAQAVQVESALVGSLAAIAGAKDAAAQHQPVNATLLQAAVEDHRAAHVRWENLVVSENSMGFHDPAEVGSELTSALQHAEAARQGATAALPATRYPVPVPTLSISRAGTDLTFTYLTSCSASDHLLLGGSLGAFGAASWVRCSIGSTGTYTVAPPPGDAWFLMAGVEGGTYSSLGRSSAGERAVSGIAAACPAVATQNTVAICP
ncbi:MAG TPA: ammonia-forming cytochrome c nitrite reductase subunit c552 [Candidatus Polarisedimenticolaceae bacterium]|nr:ammonia-forming cytochrome c nitrite reductase subunit c552 [Candidatus Polarisedimenticolaceae bacterium]